MNRPPKNVISQGRFISNSLRSPKSYAVQDRSAGLAISLELALRRSADKIHQPLRAGHGDQPIRLESAARRIIRQIGGHRRLLIEFYSLRLPRHLHIRDRKSVV